MKQLVLLIAVVTQVTVAGAQLTYNELRVAATGYTCNNLLVIPIEFKDTFKSGQPVVAGFSDAMNNHKIRLKEMQSENGADVNWLQVSNQSKEPVFIESGDVISGGKQDRMVAESKLLAAGQTDFLHVYCIEKRRWSDKPKAFVHAGTAGSNLRKTMDTKNRQHEVWQEIDRQYLAHKKTSETFTYLNLPQNFEGDSCERYFRMRYDSNNSRIAGFIFISDTTILGCEIYASATLAQLSFDRLINSYYRTAANEGSLPKIKTDSIKAFTDKFLTDAVTQKQYLEAHGKLFTANGRLLHLIAYN